MVNVKRRDELKADDLQRSISSGALMGELKCALKTALDPICGRTAVRCNSMSSLLHPKLPVRSNHALTSATPISASRVFVRYSKNSGLNTFWLRLGTGDGKARRVCKVSVWNCCAAI